MNKLAIFSRDAQQYAKLIKARNLRDVDLVIAQDTPSENDCNCDIVLCDPDLGAAALSKCRGISWVQSTWAGVKPLIKSIPQDAMLTGIKGVFGPQISEYTLAYMLHFSRQIESLQLAQQQRQWRSQPVGSLKGKTIGIMGTGSLGQAVADSAQHFGMQVKGLNRQGRKTALFDQIYAYSDREAFAKGLDFLICLLPDTSATKNIVSGTLLAALPPHCVLINAGRGACINDMALLKALDAGALRAAVLDVFDAEPLPASHPFWSHPKVLMTMHTAAISQPSDISDIFCNNYQRFVSQQPLSYLVDLDEGY